MSRATALAADPAVKKHDTGEGHPERIGRFDAACDALDGLDLLRLEPRRANPDEIALAHGRRYIRSVEDDIGAGHPQLSTGDTSVCGASLDAALHGTGAVLNAIDAVADGRAGSAFCVVRPPGHHATPDRGMGFCIFNNVAVGARYAQSKHGMARILIVDWDVHHGNGTQDIFYSDGGVFFFSTHQHPWYPGTGAAHETGYAEGEAATLNCPFPAGSGREQILDAFQTKLIPAADRFKPDLVLISAGFDSRINDPLGRFLLTDQDFRDLTTVMREVADKHAGGRLVSVLEGGYNLGGLGLAVRAHVETLL